MDAFRRVSLVAGALLLASCAATGGNRYTPGDLSEDISGIETSLRVTPTTITAGSDAGRGS